MPPKQTDEEAMTQVQSKKRCIFTIERGYHTNVSGWVEMQAKFAWQPLCTVIMKNAATYYK